MGQLRCGKHDFDRVWCDSPGEGSQISDGNVRFYFMTKIDLPLLLETSLQEIDKIILRFSRKIFDLLGDFYFSISL